MKFGKIVPTENQEFVLPPTHPLTFKVLAQYPVAKLNAYVGAPQWNKNELQGFYPKGTKDELSFYAKHFNSIEFNATFFKTPSKEQVQIWANKTPENFRFCPKITQSISHYSRLLNTDFKVLEFLDAIALFQNKLGCVFLQLNDNFSPNELVKLVDFINKFAKNFPLAVEIRSAQWHENTEAYQKYYNTLVQNQQCNLLVDTPGRQDLLHMQLSNHTAFVRFVATNTTQDYSRLDQWVDRIAEWNEAGLQNLYFFVHQEMQPETPFLAAYFIEKLNKSLQLNLTPPQKPLLLF